jgi:hypothetical protein
MIVGASSGLFACDPETLRIEQSPLGTYVGGGFVDTWENQPTVDGELWLPHASTIWATDIDEDKNTHKEGGSLFGGGQKIVEYRYFANFAVAFGEGP